MTITKLEQRIAQNAPTKRGSVTVFKIVKICAYNIAVGMICGGWLYHKFEYLPVIEQIAGGKCGQRDPRGVFYLFNCQDAAYAAVLRSDIDPETAKTYADMARDPGLPPTPKRKAR